MLEVACCGGFGWPLSPTVQQSALYHMEHKHSSSCQCAVKQTSVDQTLSELDFERGIWSAALNDETKRLKTLLGKGCDPNALDSSGYAAMHYACRNNNMESVKMLLENGADINQTTRSGGASPLHRAAYMGHSVLAKYLLSKGADPGLQDNDGKTPLHKAAERGHIEVYQLLNKTDVSLSQVTDKRGTTAAELALTKMKELLSPG